MKTTDFLHQFWKCRKQLKYSEHMIIIVLSAVLTGSDFRFCAELNVTFWPFLQRVMREKQLQHVYVPF